MSSTELASRGPGEPGAAGGADLVVAAATVLPMTGERTVLTDTAVAVSRGVIVELGPIDEVLRNHPSARVLRRSDGILTPGLIDAHQHLTGDRLARCAIPDEVDSGTAIFAWAVPLHAAHNADDDQLSASLAAAEALTNGVTTVVEAGTVAHPEAVVAGMAATGIRGVVGRWAWDRAGGGPFETDAPTALAGLAALIDAYPPAGSVRGRGEGAVAPSAGSGRWPTVTAAVTLVGHDLVSDELMVGAAALARERGVLMTMHLSPTASDPISYLARTGRRPVQHLADLGVLGRHLLLGHAVHLDDDEIRLLVETGTAVVSCPWAYLRLAQGVTVAGRHGAFLAAGGRLALGCDSENASDQIDVLRTAALAVGLIRDRAVDASGPGAWTGLELATRRGAEAVGLDGVIGTIEVGRRADLAMHRPRWSTGGGEPATELIWGGDGRNVSDVVVEGRIVVEDGRLLTVDLDALRAEGRRAGASLRARAGLPMPRR